MRQDELPLEDCARVASNLVDCEGRSKRILNSYAYAAGVVRVRVKCIVISFSYVQLFDNDGNSVSHDYSQNSWYHEYQLLHHGLRDLHYEQNCIHDLDLHVH
ncbi:hypothetical protein NL676_007257 [Syzygium grande]|nr:hypothetical protein NL676_007257 [Syzygium grande]